MSKARPAPAATPRVGRPRIVLASIGIPAIGATFAKRQIDRAARGERHLGPKRAGGEELSVVTEQDRERWRAAFEYIGASGVRLRLARIDHISQAEVFSIGSHPPWPTRVDVEAWLNEKDHAAALVEEKRFQTIRRWTIAATIAGAIAALAGIVAAWPVVFR